MMNGQSRETGNIGHIGYRKSTNSAKIMLHCKFYYYYYIEFEGAFLLRLEWDVMY
jgi:hypothetical protein